MTISPKDISELRARTGAGMMDCKKALEEAGGDMAKAAELLRAQGHRQGREAGRPERVAGPDRLAILGGRRRRAPWSSSTARPTSSRGPRTSTRCSRPDAFWRRQRRRVSPRWALDGAFLQRPPRAPRWTTCVKELTAKTGEAIALRRVARFAPANGMVRPLPPPQRPGRRADRDRGRQRATAALALARDLALHVASADPIAVAARTSRRHPRARAPDRRGAGGGRRQAGEHPGQDRRGQDQEVRRASAPCSSQPFVKDDNEERSATWSPRRPKTRAARHRVAVRPVQGRRGLMALAYRGRLLKLSGEALAGERGVGLDYGVVEAPGRGDQGGARAGRPAGAGRRRRQHRPRGPSQPRRTRPGVGRLHGHAGARSSTPWRCRTCWSVSACRPGS